MKRKMKKVLNCLLVLCMFIGSFLQTVQAATSDEKPTYTVGVSSINELESRFESLRKKYENTYWTVDGKPSNSNGDTSKWYHGKQCKAFASYIFNELFCGGWIGSTEAVYCIQNPTNATLIDKASGYSNSDETTVKNILSKAKLGDLVQAKRREKGGPHTMIIGGVTDTGVYIFDCNADAAVSCKVLYRHQTFKEFAKKNSAFSLYHSTKYPKDGPHTHSYVENYEVAHPHRVYKKCTCGDINYTGSTKTIGSCNLCMSIDSKYSKLIGFKAYPCVTANFEVKNADLTTRAGEIYTTDECTINAVYTNGWCNVTFPTKNSTITAYTPISNFIKSPSTPLTEVVATKYIDLYSTSSLSNKIYRIYPNDKCYMIGSYGSSIQIFMPLSSGGYVLGWIKSSEISLAKYTISYDGNGGTSVPSSQTQTHGTSISVSTQKPTKSYVVTYNANGGSVTSSNKTLNCTFTNWNTDKNGNGTKINAGSSYMPNKNITLYATYSNPKLGNLPIPTRNGYVFKGWNTKADGSGVSVNENTVISSNTTLYAQWNVKIVFNSEGGTFKGVIDTCTVDGINSPRGVGDLVIYNESETKVDTNAYGKEFIIDGNGQVTAKRDYGSTTQLTVPSSGYILSGHIDQVDNTVATFIGKIEVGNYIAYNSSTNKVTLYATFNDYLYENKVMDVNGTYCMLPVPTKEGYYFEGWYTQANGGSLITYYSDYSTNQLYAHWSEKPVAVASTTYNNHKYEVFDYSISWDEAKALCEKLGGHLVTITDNKENQIVQSLISKGTKGYYAMGAVSKESLNNWGWVTDEKFDWQNWDTGYQEGKEDYRGYIISIENLPNKQPGDWIDDKNINNQPIGYYHFSNVGFVCEYDQVIKPIESVVLNETSIIVEKKHSDSNLVKNLKATVSPNDATDSLKVTWESSNPLVAEVVSNGLEASINIKSAGTTVIAVTTSNGKKAYCTIEVKVLHEYSENYFKDEASHWKECTCGEISEKALHQYGEWQVVTEATEDTKGLKKKSCEVCGYEVTEEIEKLSHTHTMEKVEEKEATHKAEGIKEHYQCTKCDKLYSDINGTTEITKADTVIAKISHTFGDYKNDSQNHWKECTCGEISEKAGHQYGEWAENDTERKRTCVVCGYEEIEITSSSKIIVSNATAIKGQQVDVTIEIEGNPGISSMQLAVGYDSSKLRLVKVTDGEKLGSAIHTDNYDLNPYYLSWANDLATENITSNGTIVTLTFEVVDGAELGSTEITVGYDYENYDIVNVDALAVKFATINGTINITDVMMGDVNGDGKVNTLDRMLLTRCLAKWTGYGEDSIVKAAADVNQDGRINTLDRMILTRYLAKWTGYDTL